MELKILKTLTCSVLILSPSRHPVMAKPYSSSLKKFALFHFSTGNVVYDVGPTDQLVLKKDQAFAYDQDFFVNWKPPGKGKKVVKRCGRIILMDGKKNFG